MSTKLFNLNPRKPISEEAARRLEEAIAAKGEGIAGHELVSSQAHEPTESQVHELVSLQGQDIPSGLEKPSMLEIPEGVRAEEAAVEAPPAAAVRSAPGGRTRKGRPARELPSTGVGTLHNPRVRKTDGVKTRSTTVHLPVELAKKLAVHCAVSGRKQSEVIAEAVQVMLGD